MPRGLRDPRLYRGLILANILVTLGTALAMRHEQSNDHRTYFNLAAAGLLQGKYSFCSCRSCASAQSGGGPVPAPAASPGGSWCAAWRSLRSSGVVGKLRALYPTVLTLTLFAIGLPFAVAQTAGGRASFTSTRHLWLVILYAWAVHIPMTIQSRYTVPLHMPALMLVALALGAIADGWTAGTPSVVGRTPERRLS